MFVFDKMVDEDRRDDNDATHWLEMKLPNGSTKTLGPSARDAFSVFEDLCLLANSEKPNFLKLEFLHKTFALELIESVLTNYHDLFRKARVAGSPLVMVLSVRSTRSWCSSSNSTSALYSSKRCPTAHYFRLRSAVRELSFCFSSNSPSNLRLRRRSSSCCSSRSSATITPSKGNNLGHSGCASSLWR